MRGIKHIFAIVFCCAFIMSGSAKAMFPVFDIVEAPQSFSKIPVVFDQVKNLKDQLMAMQANLKAMGDKIKSIAMFAKDIADKIVDAYEEVSGYAEDVEERLNLNGDRTREAQRAAQDVEEATEDVVDNTVGETEDIIDDTDNDTDEDKDEEVAPTTSIFAPTEPIRGPIVREPPLNIPGHNTPNVNAPVVIPGNTLPSLNEPVVVPEDTSSSNNPVVAPKVERNVPTNAPVIVSPSKSLGDRLNGAKPGLTLPADLDLDVEEEEEEEEISVEEENAKIEEVRESIKNALLNFKEIKTHFNDLLDLSISSIQQNSDENSKTLDNIVLVINRAENLENKEKTLFISEVNSIKEKQIKLTDRLIGVVDGIKTNYNLAYKDKIEDGYKNYEKVAVAYIKGDISKEEFKNAGKKLKNEARLIDIVPDKMVIAEVDEKIKEIKNELVGLTNKIKQAEEKKQKI